MTYVKISTKLQNWRFIILFKHMCVLPNDTAQYSIDLPRIDDFCEIGNPTNAHSGELF